MEADQQFSGLKVLLLDDDFASRDLLSSFLKELGISDITEITNGIDAVAFMDQNPDWRGVILSDWNMPRMSGTSFYRQIKNTHPDIPFIMVTARNDEDSVYFAKDHGIFAYLLKPYTFEELERKIRRVTVVGAEFLGADAAFSQNGESSAVEDKVYTI